MIASVSRMRGRSTCPTLPRDPAIRTADTANGVSHGLADAEVKLGGKALEVVVGLDVNAHYLELRYCLSGTQHDTVRTPSVQPFAIG
jgi:hypothetical protein